MKWVYAVIVFGAAGGVAGMAGQQVDGNAELKSLQGVWLLTAQEPGGRGEICLKKVVFEGNKVTFKIGAELWDAKAVLDASKDPKWIDLAMTTGPFKGDILRGVYRFLDDELFICLPDFPAGERPTDFTASTAVGGGGRSVIVLKRRDEPRGVVQGSL